jgi:twinkle protein
VCRIIPHACRAILKEKDANECLKEGYVKDTFNACYWNAQAPKNSRIIWGTDVHEEAKEPPEWGLSTPWEGLTDITRGIRFGETWYIGAGEKMGKSEIVNALAAHLITEHNLKVLLAKPEEVNKKTYKLLVGKVAGKIFHDPKIEFDMEAYEKAGKLVKSEVAMLNLYQHIDWEVLKGDITYAAAQGVKAVFIDPITNLTNRMGSSERNDALMGISEELAAMSKDLDIVIFIFCHLNKPAKGMTPWDRGGKITTDFFAGSSAMARSCNYAVGMQGNKDPDEPIDVRNMRELAVLADREFGESGSVHLFWNKDNGQFTEMKR